jgi:hypothetical protein
VKTKTLLACGIIGGPVFVLAFLVEGAKTFRCVGCAGRFPNPERVEALEDHLRSSRATRCAEIARLIREGVEI